LVAFAVDGGSEGPDHEVPLRSKKGVSHGCSSVGWLVPADLVIGCLVEPMGINLVETESFVRRRWPGSGISRDFVDSKSRELEMIILFMRLDACIGEWICKEEYHQNTAASMR